MEIHVYEIQSGKHAGKQHHTVDIKTDDMHIIAYLVSTDELYDFLHRLPNLYDVIHYMEHLADDVMSDMRNYHEIVNFLRDHKKRAGRALIRNQRFYCLEPINL